MKVPFLFLSMALHAAALAYPALHRGSQVVIPVTVTLIDVGESGGGDGGSGEAPIAKKKMMAALDRAAAERRQARSLIVPKRSVSDPDQESASPQTVDPVGVAPEAHGAAVVTARSSRLADAVEQFATPSASGKGASGMEGSSGGHHDGLRGGVSGSLDGRGSGRGDKSGNGRVVSLSASYDYCPRPETPEIARRNKWRGTVLLRVLVDEQGNPRSLELNRSSGFAVLDDAAIENVKRHCRFHPASEGDKRVASWIRIPVVFPLPDEKN